MAWLNADEQDLLGEFLERRVDRNRKNLPHLRPLSIYSSELKSIKHMVDTFQKGVNGEPLHPTEGTAKRYANTLETQGFHDQAANGAIVPNAAGDILLALAATGDGSAEFWQGHGRLADRISFDHQLQRLAGKGAGAAAVNQAWRSAFFNVQTLLDHVPDQLIRAALDDPALSEVEALQFMNSVGTEPWRYARMEATKRALVPPLLLRLRSKWEEGDASGNAPVETAARQYGEAMSKLQRDVRFRVAGFVEAFLEARGALGASFPRMSPGLVATFPPGSAGGGSGAPSEAGQAAATPLPDSPIPLAFPRQLIVSGCPGSGKSHLAEGAVGAARLIRTQFHADTSFANFLGSYRPVPVYQAAPDVRELGGTEFSAGRPLIDYRFVPGPALIALEAALKDSSRNVVLLIEELNRANAAAVFGELFQLLDRDGAGVSRYGVEMQPEAAAWMAARGVLPDDGLLRLPGNLYIWGTMNSGDQGVFPLDTAFRRRWSFRYLGYSQPCELPHEQRVVRFGGRDFDWDVLRGQVNAHLKGLGVDEDRLIGPYFLKPEELPTPAAMLEKVLLYLWDDVLRFRHDGTFRDGSFAEVATTWANGEGDPFVAGIVDPADAIPFEEVAPAEPAGTKTAPEPVALGPDATA